MELLAGVVARAESLVVELALLILRPGMELRGSLD